MSKQKIVSELLQKSLILKLTVKVKESSVLNTVQYLDMLIPTGLNLEDLVGYHCLNKLHKCLIKILLFGQSVLAYFTAYFKH